MESICTNAMHQALAQLEQDVATSPAWCMPLVDSLESLSQGSAIEWCVEVVVNILGKDLAESDKFLVRDLSELASSGLDVVTLKRKSREIWYGARQRSVFRTAVAKVYEAVAAYVKGDVIRYRRGVGSVVGVIAIDAIVSTSDERVRTALEIFNRKCQSLHSDMKMD